MIQVDFLLRTQGWVPALGAPKIEPLCKWLLPQVPGKGEVITLSLNLKDRDQAPERYRVIDRSWTVSGELDNDNPNSYSQGILHARVLVVKEIG